MGSGVKKFMVEKFRFKKSRVEKFMVEMSGVEKFMVEKSVVENFPLALVLNCLGLKLGVDKSRVEISYNR